MFPFYLKALPLIFQVMYPFGKARGDETGGGWVPPLFTCKQIYSKISIFKTILPAKKYISSSTLDSVCLKMSLTTQLRAN